MSFAADEVDTRSIHEVYAEGLRYFMGEGELNSALKRLGTDLDEHQIDYVVIGAVALMAYGYPRFTEDIDIVMTPEALDRFRQELVGLGYKPAFSGAKKTFRSTLSGSKIEIITSNSYPGDGKPKPVGFPVPPADSNLIDGVRIVTLEKLVDLKLASGMTAPDRLKDLADVQELIKFRGLDSEFATRLDPYVRERFLDLWRTTIGTGEK